MNDLNQQDKKDPNEDKIQDYLNINEYSENGDTNQNPNDIKIESNNKQNTEYYDEFNRPKYDDIIKFENELRLEIENSSPLISELLEIDFLTNEFKDSIFVSSIKEITTKYKKIRTVRRDGNCFYRSYLFRIFEHIVQMKDKKLTEKIIKLSEESKDIIVNNGYEWIVVEDFYNMFVSELKFISELDPVNKEEYLKLLFSDKEKCNYLIAYIRMFIAAYIRQNRILYENFILEDLDSWVRRDVEPVDVECDHLQIIAVTNCFGVGVIIENLNEKKIETMKFPEEGCDYYFTKMLFRPGHYDILYD